MTETNAMGPFISAYCDAIKDGVGRLDMNYEIQMKLAEDEGDEDDSKPPLRGEAAEQHKAAQARASGPALASAREVGERSRPKAN